MPINTFKFYLKDEENGLYYYRANEQTGETLSMDAETDTPCWVLAEENVDLREYLCDLKDYFATLLSPLGEPDEDFAFAVHAFLQGMSVEETHKHTETWGEALRGNILQLLV